MFNTSYIKFTLHVYELKFTSGGEGDGDGELMVNFIRGKKVSTYLWLITLSSVIGSHRACECWMNYRQFHHYFLSPPKGHPSLALRVNSIHWNGPIWISFPSRTGLVGHLLYNADLKKCHSNWMQCRVSTCCLSLTHFQFSRFISFVLTLLQWVVVKRLNTSWQPPYNGKRRKSCGNILVLVS